MNPFDFSSREQLEKWKLRMAKYPPLSYVYLRGSSVIANKRFLPEEKGNLVGVLIAPETVLLLKTFTKEDLEELTKKKLNESDDSSVTREDISAWARENFSNFKNPRLITKEDFEGTLMNTIGQANEMFNFLKCEGIPAQNIHWRAIAWLSDESDALAWFDGEITFENYLQNGRCLFFIADYTRKRQKKV